MGNWDKTNHDATYVPKLAASSQTSAGVALATVAGATEDNQKVTGYTIDRAGFETVELVISYLASLAATKALKFAVEIQESDDGLNWDTAVALLAATTVDTGESGGSNEYGVYRLSAATIGIKARKRYCRFNVTPDLSATSTDACIWTAMAILGGSAILPAAAVS